MLRAEWSAGTMRLQNGSQSCRDGLHGLRLCVLLVSKGRIGNGLVEYFGMGEVPAYPQRAKKWRHRLCPFEHKPNGTPHNTKSPHIIPTMSISSIQNKVVVITGCSSGIGLATTRLFLERQALVFGIDVGAIPQKLADEHDTFTFHQTNLTESRAVDEAISRCQQQYGRIDVLVNCAGVSDGWSSADTIKEDEWERVMSINLTVPIRLMKAVLPFMKEQKGGSIVNVASKAGVSGAAAGIAYTASKHGLVSLRL